MLSCVLLALGYLKVTITCLGPGDEQKSHDGSDDDEEGDTDDLSKLVLMPPSVPQETHLLMVKVARSVALSICLFSDSYTHLCSSSKS